MTTTTTAATTGQLAAAGPLEDLSPGTRRRASRTTWKSWRGRLLRILVPILLILVWQAAISFNFTSQATLPSPETVLKAYHELWSEGSLQAALPISLERAGIGLLIGATIGLVLGVFAGLWKIGEEIFDAPLQMLRTIPFIALVPLFITWFGIDEKPKIILIATATVFPMYLNTYHGVRSVDVKLIEAGQVFGLSGLRLAWRVILPSALPGALTGLRYATGVALLALVLAEQINSSAGIGYLIETANQNQRPDIVIAGILIYAALGIIADIIMRLVEHFALPWRPRVAIG